VTEAPHAQQKKSKHAKKPSPKKQQAAKAAAAARAPPPVPNSKQPPDLAGTGVLPLAEPEPVPTFFENLFGNKEKRVKPRVAIDGTPLHHGQGVPDPWVVAPQNWERAFKG
jgi:hypothetical protein